MQWLQKLSSQSPQVVRQSQQIVSSHRWQTHRSSAVTVSPQSPHDSPSQSASSTKGLLRVVGPQQVRDELEEVEQPALRQGLANGHAAVALTEDLVEDVGMRDPFA